jgi:hypothetical protein
VDTRLFPISPLHTFCYPASSVYNSFAGNTKFPRWVVLYLYFYNSDNVLSNERHLFPSLKAHLSISPSISTKAIFRYNQAIYKALTNITVSRPVQTEVVRKFTGSTGLGIYQSFTAATDCNCLGGKLY